MAIRPNSLNLGGDKLPTIPEARIGSPLVSRLRPLLHLAGGELYLMR